MNELQVIVEQQPGTISWNYQDLREALQQEMELYKGMQYDDSSIQAAKADVAMLRKLRKAVDDKRKEIKTQCLLPYEIIETQAKELIGLIDEPIDLISEQTKEYDRRCREERKGKIIKYMTEAFAGLPPEVAKKAQFATYDAKWETKSANVSDWKCAIDGAAVEIRKALITIDGVEEDFRQDAYNAYLAGLSLPDAMQKVQELQRQREIILERERQKDDARRKHEAELAAAEAERIATKPEPAPAEAQKIEDMAENSGPAENCAVITQNNEQQVQQAPASAPAQAEPRVTAIIQLFDASDAQVRQILDYIKTMNIRYTARRPR